MGERLEHLKRSHLALEADDLIPENIMQNVYGKEPERQVRMHTCIVVSTLKNHPDLSTQPYF